MTTPNHTRRSPCRDETHRFKAGTRKCLTCNAAYQRVRRWGATPMLIPAGETTMNVRARKAWATKRERYGPSGTSPELSRRLAEALRQQPWHWERAHQTLCQRGHVILGRAPDGRRYCTECIKLRRRGGRPEWVQHGEVRISIAAHDAYYLRTLSILRHRMLAAHPDKGGTTKRFIDARKRHDVFIQSEAMWYRGHGLKPPGRQVAQRQVAA